VSYWPTKLSWRVPDLSYVHYLPTKAHRPMRRPTYLIGEPQHVIVTERGGAFFLGGTDVCLGSGEATSVVGAPQVGNNNVNMNNSDNLTTTDNR
jgi:hypothetical protein